MNESSLKVRIQEEMKSAMRAKEMARLGTIRMLLAAMKQKEVDERITLTDSDIVSIINKMIKQRNESITQFKAGGRPELADKEEQEITWLSHYLPQQLSDAQLNALIEEAFQASGATQMKDMGKVMPLIKEKAAGRVDMALVSAKIRERLK